MPPGRGAGCFSARASCGSLLTGAAPRLGRPPLCGIYFSLADAQAHVQGQVSRRSFAGSVDKEQPVDSRLSRSIGPYGPQPFGRRGLVELPFHACDAQQEAARSCREAGSAVYSAGRHDTKPTKGSVLSQVGGSTRALSQPPRWEPFRPLARLPPNVRGRERDRQSGARIQLQRFGERRQRL